MKDELFVDISNYNNLMTYFNKDTISLTEIRHCHGRLPDMYLPQLTLVPIFRDLKSISDEKLYDNMYVPNLIYFILFHKIDENENEVRIRYNNCIYYTYDKRDVYTYYIYDITLHGVINLNEVNIRIKFINQPNIYNSYNYNNKLIYETKGKITVIIDHCMQSIIGNKIFSNSSVYYLYYYTNKDVVNKMIELLNYRVHLTRVYKFIPKVKSTDIVNLGLNKYQIFTKSNILLIKLRTDCYLIGHVFTDKDRDNIVSMELSSINDETHGIVIGC